jgi:hypothetical protein
MGRELYGSLNNRIEENHQFCDKIEVGTGMTEYFYSDRHAYEVIEVRDQKHVTVREYDHKKVGDIPMSNDWELVSNQNNATMSLVKRGKYWYSETSLSPEEAKEIFEGNDIEAKIWACQCGFDLQAIIESGKTKKHYRRRNVSFGVAKYYYDYEF